jgi:hypothetical protein
MLFERQTIDGQPLATTSDNAGRFAQIVGGERLGQMVDANVARTLRQRTELWAKTRGLLIAESMITYTDEGVTARIPLYEVSAETAVIRGTAAQPAKVSLVIEQKSFWHRLRRGFQTGDVGFDRQWHVSTNDVSAAHQLVDEECREILRDAGCGCYVSYEDGELQVRVDTTSIAGTHLLSGIELVVLLGSKRLQTSAYR